MENFRARLVLDEDMDLNFVARQWLRVMAKASKESNLDIRKLVEAYVALLEGMINVNDWYEALRGGACSITRHKVRVFLCYSHICVLCMCSIVNCNNLFRFVDLRNILGLSDSETDTGVSEVGKSLSTIRREV